ncbi:MAG: hypothetical protein KQJ78_21880 [Deltaproteobacteria bacterium]|nr:hypothetical protein [Deltaproteobacteria bacterium]
MRITRRLAWVVALLAGLAILPLGCGGSNESTGGGGTLGYTITLTVTSNIVRQLGETTLLITVLRNGEPVPDDTDVTLTSSLAGTLTTPVTTVNGRATSVFTAPEDRVGTARITASSLGAFAWVDILVVAN